MVTSSLSGRQSWLSLGWKIAAIPLLFLLAILFILLFTVLSAREQKMDAVVTDMATRQRVFNREHLLNVLLESQGTPADSEQIRSLLKETITSLKNGGNVTFVLTGETTRIPGAPTEAIRQAFLEEEKALGDFARAADAFQEVARDDPDYSARLQELRDLNDTADREANEAVKAFTAHSQTKIESLIRSVIAIALTAAVLGIVCSWLIARGILKPLGRVVGMSQEIASGNLTGQQLTIRAGDEVGRLADGFNRMQLSLRDLAGQIREATENVNSASAEILASTQEQAANTKQQAATVQQITATMQEITQSGRQVIDKARQVATSGEATSAASRSGIQAVQGTTRTMESIRDQVEEVAENIVTLSEKTQAVGEIVATVNEIAEQSNLLALNASIEAASAGADGTRFSVVAGEMKHLAEQAKECTVQVRTILGDIQKGINTSVMLTEEAVKRVETGKHQAETSERIIRDMNATTEQSVQAFEQIIGASNQQQIGFEQVAQGMQDIRQAAEQTAMGTSQLEQAVANLSSMSQQLRAAVGRYRL